MDNERPVRVLFVCHENCNRSQMAEAFARIYGGRSVEAYSAGWCPAQAVDSKAIAAMHELGYDLRRHLPKGFSDLPEVEYDVVVVICDDGWPGVRAKRWEHWNVAAPKGLPPERFRAVRDQIACKVKGLLARLSVSLNTEITRPEYHRKEPPRVALECQMTKSGG